MGLFNPAFIPLIFHWYDAAAPPLMAVALKVTGVPAQTGLADGIMVTLTGRIGFTVMVTGVAVAGLPVAQVALDVSSQVTRSLFAGI